MPRKKRTIVEETLPDTDNDGGLDVSTTDYLCVLSKVHKITGSVRSYCFETQEPVTELSIQQTYPNGGKFVVTEYNATGQLLNTNHYDIEPSVLPTATHTNGHNVSEITMLRDELNFSRNMVLTMIQGMFNNKQNGTTITELVTALQGLNGLTNGKDPVELLIKGMELGQNSAGGGKGSDWKTEVVSGVKDVAPYVIQAFAGARQQQPVQGEPTMVATTPAAMIQQGLSWIKPQIMAGMQPNLAVGMLVQFANSPQYQPLLATAIQGDINTFIQIDPEIANEPYRTWFTVAIQLLKEWYAEQSNVDSDSDGGIGDDTDAPNDAPVSTGKPKVTKVS